MKGKIKIMGMVSMMLFCGAMLVSCQNNRDVNSLDKLRHSGEKIEMSDMKGNEAEVLDNNHEEIVEIVQEIELPEKIGGHVQFKKNEIGLAIRENPTTGYRWSWSEEGPADESEMVNHFIMTDDDYEMDNRFGPNGEQMAGVGGMRKFRFEIRDESGCREIKFVNSRSWEPPSVNNIHFEILVCMDELGMIKSVQVK